MDRDGFSVTGTCASAARPRRGLFRGRGRGHVLLLRGRDLSRPGRHGPAETWPAWLRRRPDDRLPPLLTRRPPGPRKAFSRAGSFEDQHLVDAAAVEIDDLDPPALDVDHVAHLGQRARHLEHQARHRLELPVESSRSRPGRRIRPPASSPRPASSRPRAPITLGSSSESVVRRLAGDRLEQVIGVMIPSKWPPFVVDQHHVDEGFPRRRWITSSESMPSWTTGAGCTRLRRSKAGQELPFPTNPT